MILTRYMLNAIGVGYSCFTDCFAWMKHGRWSCWCSHPFFWFGWYSDNWRTITRAGTHKIEVSENIILRHEPFSWYQKKWFLAPFFWKKYIVRGATGGLKFQHLVYLVDRIWPYRRFFRLYAYVNMVYIQRRNQYWPDDSSADRFSATWILYILHSLLL